MYSFNRRGRRGNVEQQEMPPNPKYLRPGHVFLNGKLTTGACNSKRYVLPHETVPLQKPVETDLSKQAPDLPNDDLLPNL
jgi:hypothetical protein